MIEGSAEVTNSLGIHARPAAQIVRTASEFDSRICIIFEGDSVSAKSIMGVMTLAASHGTILKVTADGTDEEDALNAILDLIKEGFGED